MEIHVAMSERYGIFEYYNFIFIRNQRKKKKNYEN